MGFNPIGVKAAIEMCGVDRVVFGTDFGPVPFGVKEHVEPRRSGYSRCPKSPEGLLENHQIPISISDSLSSPRIKTAASSGFRKGDRSIAEPRIDVHFHHLPNALEERSGE
jgi:hypothetical protein